MPTFTWSSPVDDVSLDVGVGSFDWTDTITVSGYLNGNLVASYDPTIYGHTTGGNWDTIDFSSPIDEVTLKITGGNGFAFGIDNLTWTAGASSSVPDGGSTLTLLGLAMAACCFVRRKSRSDS